MFNFLDKIQRSNSLKLIDKLSFFHIFLIWFLVITIFGFVYFFATNNFSHLLYSKNNLPVDNIFDTIYFSFVTATTTGFGDIIPSGFFKIVSVFEVIFGLLLLAIVTSKLVSIKQNAILEEVYEISFNERINRLRSGLLLFRQNTERLIIKTEEKLVKTRDIKSFNNNLESLTEILDEIFFIISKKRTNKLLVMLDAVNAELLVNGTIASFEKLVEFFESLKENNLKWGDDIPLDSIDKLLLLNKLIFSNLSSTKIPQDKVTFFEEQNEKTIAELKKFL